MLIGSASVLVLVIAAVAAMATFAASPGSSPAVQVSAGAGSPAGRTSTAGASTAPTPKASTPSPAGQSTVASSTAAPTGPTAVRVTKLVRVDVVTTFAGWNGLSQAVEVGGYAAVVEPVGTCTLRLSMGTDVVTRTHIASADATTVACGGFSIPRGELSTGDWKAVLEYRSPTSTGEAVAVTLKVP